MLVSAAPSESRHRGLAVLLGIALPVVSPGCAQQERQQPGPGAPQCGNGAIDPGEQCDDGNEVSNDGCSDTCRDERFGDLVVQWAFNTGEAGQDDPAIFTSDSCLDFMPASTGTNYARLSVVTGPAPAETMVDCRPQPERHPHQRDLVETSLAGLPVGDYVFEASIVYDNGTGGVPIGGPKRLALTIPPGAMPNPPPIVVFGSGDFAPSPEGTLLFQTFFGGPDAGGCTTVLPPVAEQRLTLRTATGEVVTARTDTGLATDGVDSGPCRWPGTAAEAQRVENLPSGRYTLRIEGLTAEGSPAYCEEARVFVGAGQSNPTYSITVPAKACL